MKDNKERLRLLLIMGFLFFGSNKLIDQVINRNCTDNSESLVKEDEDSGLVIDGDYLLRNQLEFSCNKELTPEDYDIINRKIGIYDVDTLRLTDLNLDYIDFAKIDCSSLTTLIVDGCHGIIDLAPLETSEHLRDLKIFQTNFINLDKLHCLKRFTISSYRMISAISNSIPNFKLDQSFEEIFNSIKRSGSELTYLCINSFPISSVDISVGTLDIFYGKESQIPEVLEFDAKTLKLSGVLYTDYLYQAPMLSSSSCEIADIFFFDTTIEKMNTSCSADFRFSACNINNSIEEIITNNIELDTTTLNKQNTSYTTYYDYAQKATLYINDKTNEEVGKNNREEKFPVKIYKNLQGIKGTND